MNVQTGIAIGFIVLFSFIGLGLFVQIVFSMMGSRASTVSRPINYGKVLAEILRNLGK